MKKVAPVCLCFALLVSLAGCGGKSTLNSANTRLGKQAIQLLDDYLDGKMSLDELYAAYYEKFETLDHEDDSENILNFIFSMDDVLVHIRLYNEATEENVLKWRNSIARKVA